MSNEPTPETPDNEGPVPGEATPAEPIVPADPTREDPAFMVGDDSVADVADVDPLADADADADANADDADADADADVAGFVEEPAPDGDRLLHDETTAPPPAAAYAPPETPPYVATAPVRRLVRDPYSRLGGVASGIAHHTGIDVSLIRLAFVVATIFSGVGLILYLLAWLIVPRAEYWPPAPYQADAGGSRFEGRQLAYGLLALGILLVIFSGAGGFARMIVSIGLVGAGIWLLVQPQSPTESTASGIAGSTTPPPGTPASPSVTTTGDTGTGVPSTWQPASGSVGPDVSGGDVTSSFAPIESGSTATATTTSGSSGAPVNTVYVPSPVPPRRRRVWPFFLIGAIFVIPVLFLIAGIAFFAINEDEFTEADLLVEPLSPADIPRRIDEGAGTITLDLANLTVDDFSEIGVGGKEVDIDLNAGEIVVELPPDVPVAIDASAGAGEITVLDRHEEGIRPRITTDNEDAVLELDIRVGVGSITVDD